MERTKWNIQLGPRGGTVVKDGVDISDEIREIRVYGFASGAPTVVVAYTAESVDMTVDEPPDARGSACSVCGDQWRRHTDESRNEHVHTRKETA